ncbi:MAG TPA: endonuclease/exonuclease/phosphatase family protein [Vicinamibacteria bacterium]
MRLPGRGGHHGSGVLTSDFSHPANPRFVGQTSHARCPTDALRVVSFNIRYSQNVAGAIEVLGAHGQLREPDVLLLQEMDLRGVREIASALKLNYVYYPAARHPLKMARDAQNGIPRSHPEFGFFGTAVLSPWRLEDDQKILLGRGYDRALKAAVAATVRWGDRKVRAVSVHLPRPLREHFEFELRGLVACVLDGACESPTLAVGPDRWADREPAGNFVIGGDFNSSGGAQLRAIGRVFAGRGEEAPGLHSTFNLLHFRILPRWLSFDHIVHGRTFSVSPMQSGVVAIPRAVSDHHPVWAVLKVRQP